MITIEHLADRGSVATERLVLGFDARCKSRLRTRLASGEEVGLFLERGTVLRGGDRLLAKDGRIVEVVAGDETLIEATCSDPLVLARAAYHLGNRHVAVQIGEGCLRFAFDHVLGDMVAGLGLTVTRIVAPFEPEAGAYAHKEVPLGDSGHSGGHSHDGSGAPGTPTTPGAKIHQYRKDS